MVGVRYGKTIDTVASLGHVFNNRKIRFVITYTIIEIEEIGLMVIFLKWPKLPRRPGGNLGRLLKHNFNRSWT